MVLLLPSALCWPCVLMQTTAAAVTSATALAPSVAASAAAVAPPAASAALAPALAIAATVVPPRVATAAEFRLLLLLRL